MKRMFSNGRYANVAATLALVLAMGGTSYAAYALPHNSVGSWQIKTKSVKNSDLGSSSVTTSKVKDGSLYAQDFAAGQLPAGPAGEAAAFADVLSNGTLNGGNPWPNVGFPNGRVTHAPGTGIYCIGGLDFAPRSAQVTVTDPGPASHVPYIAAVAVDHGTGGVAGCPLGYEQARVTITQVDHNNAPALTDHGFSIWFED